MAVSPQPSGKGGRKLRSRARLEDQVQDEEEWRSGDTFNFSGLPSPKSSQKPRVKKSPYNRKLRRQTMMPTRLGVAAAAAPTTLPTFTSPPLSRRTRRQSMMPIKLPNDPGNNLKKVVKITQVSPTPAGRITKVVAKRKLAEDVEAVKDTNKKGKSRHTPASKSKSLSSLPAARASRKSLKTQNKDKKIPSPKKRALSPSKHSSPARKKPSPVKKISGAQSNFVRSKSLPRGRKTVVPQKPSTPSPKKAVTPKMKKILSVRVKDIASPKGKMSANPSKKKKMEVTLSPAKKSSKKTEVTLSPAKKSSKKMEITLSPAKKSSQKTEVTLSPAKKSSKKTEVTLSPAKISTAKKNAPKQKQSRVKMVSPSKTPSQPTPPPPPPPQSSSSKTSRKTPAKSRPKPNLTPQSSVKKTNKNKNKKLTPNIVSKKVNTTPTSSKRRKKVTATPKHTPQSTPSPRKARLTRSAARVKRVKVRVSVDGKSPATSRKTPSSKKELGMSPIVPSAHTQLQRIRHTITSAHKRHTTPPPRKPPPHTTTTATATATPGLDKADIHAAGNGKCGSEPPLENHCAPLQTSTPATLPSWPLTPKSSRGSSSSRSQFRTRFTSSTVMVESRHVQQNAAAAAAEHSSTPLSGSHTLEVIGVRPLLKEEKEGGVEGDADMEDDLLDLSLEESVDTSTGETSIEEEEEEEDEEEEEEESSITQGRKSYCSLM